MINNIILDKRTTNILELLVEDYIENAHPVPSEAISKKINCSISAASVRNITSMLSMLGLVYAPHSSAGKIPTETGLRFFVDNIMKINQTRKNQINKLIQLQDNDKFYNAEKLIQKITENLSVATHCLGFVSNNNIDENIKHIEFVAIENNKAAVIIVKQQGEIKTEIFDIPEKINAQSISQANNYINSQIKGKKNLAQITTEILQSIDNIGSQIDHISKTVLKNGAIALIDKQKQEEKNIVIYGMANLLKCKKNQQDIKKLQKLFQAIEEKKSILKLIKKAQNTEGITVFIGAESRLNYLSGMTLITTPYKFTKDNVAGMLGVIGPIYLNYKEVIPMVDYSAKLISRNIH